jgi:lysophospholipase L1-like esterase
MSLTRRDFLAGSVTAVASTRYAGPAAPPRATSVILFQGDSITDVGRDRKHGEANNQAGLGGGYPLLCAAALRDRDAARDLQIYNRGVSGNTVTDMAARWDTDTLALKPDVLSILIGVNDIWHTLMGQYNGTPEKYQRGFRDLLDRTRTALPHVHLVILEPFVLRTGAVSEKWFPEFDQFRVAASRVAHDLHATFIPLHEMFQQLAKKTGPSYWLMDGVHPTLAGHAAITHRWLDAVKV